MASAAVVAGLLAGWGVAALVLGLFLGRMMRMRDRQRADAMPRPAVALVTTGWPGGRVATRRRRGLTSWRPDVVAD
jgi:hypothetical protein